MFTPLNLSAQYHFVEECEKRVDTEDEQSSHQTYDDNNDSVVRCALRCGPYDLLELSLAILEVLHDTLLGLLCGRSLFGLVLIL